MRLETIRARLLLLTLGVTLCSVLVAALAVARTFTRERDALTQSLRETTRALSSAVERELARREGIAATMAASRELRRGDFAAFHLEASDALKGTEDWVVLTDRERELVNTRFAFGTPLAPRGATEAFAERPRVSSLHVGPTSGVLVTAAMVPVFIDGAPVYNVVLNSPAGQVQRLVDAQRLPVDWIATVLDQNGRVIARTINPERWVGGLATESARAVLSLPEREGLLHSRSLDGRPTASYYAKLASHGWTVFIGIPEGVLGGSLSGALGEIGIAALALLLLAALLAFHVGRRIAQPLAHLGTAAEALKTGKPVRYVEQNVAEVDAVGRALEQAADAIATGQRALRESEAMYRSLGEAVPNFVWSSDTSGRALYVNARWIEYTGLSLDEANERGWESVVHPDDLPELRRRWTEAAAAGAAFEGEYRHRGRDGVFRWFIARAIPIRNDAGAIERWLGASTDISERRQLEERLREESRRKDEFLATLSHELRNPMAPIRYAARLLATGTPAVVEQARGVIERQAAMMARLLDDLLDVSRITRGIVELKLDEVDLRDVLKQAGETVQPLLEHKRQTLSVSMPPAPLVVRGDAARLQQVVGNLLDNAAKYSEPGSGIELTLAPGSPGTVEIRVRDHGIGLAPDMVPRVFDLFAQLHRSLNVDRGGLGIGLTVVKRLIELHGGHIEVASAGLGAGSIFTVVLPLAVGGTAAASGAGNVIPLYKGQPRTLVVDDNQDAAETLAALLRAHGFAVSVAFDAAAGLAAFDATRPAVVLLDLGLPDRDGFEVAREIRRRPGGERVMLVAVTGWGQERDRALTRDAGFDLHLVKPVDPTRILELLRGIAIDPGSVAGAAS